MHSVPDGIHGFAIQEAGFVEMPEQFEGRNGSQVLWRHQMRKVEKKRQTRHVECVCSVQDAYSVYVAISQEKSARIKDAKTARDSTYA